MKGGKQKIKENTEAKRMIESLFTHKKREIKGGKQKVRYVTQTGKQRDRKFDYTKKRY